ncbi:MAG: amidohydrolase family protein [Bryobacterales bacterium]|nr:amidohydrolase family protein [Bryobacterales bacterium]
MRNGFRVFDAHAHLGRARHSGRVATLQGMLRSMDAAGVDRTLLIPFPVVEDYRREHDEIGAALRSHPDRFAGAACLDPFVPESMFREEVRRCREAHGFRALKFQPQYQGLNPLSERSDFLFETALENEMVLVCHTGAGAPFALPSLFIHPARRFPGLRIVLGHAGGGLYVLEAIVAPSVCPNIYIELSTLMPHAVLEILGHVGADRLMAGSDLPESLETEIGKILGLPIPERSKQEILWETAAALFGE